MTDINVYKVIHKTLEDAGAMLGYNVQKTLVAITVAKRLVEKLIEEEENVKTTEEIDESLKLEKLV